tara:strand:- start:905 stop:1198 length:294 start_codon:yes stop_codon:yes gene_type:complete
MTEENKYISINHTNEDGTVEIRKYDTQEFSEEAVHKFNQLATANTEFNNQNNLLGLISLGKKVLESELSTLLPQKYEVVKPDTGVVESNTNDTKDKS